MPATFNSWMVLGAALTVCFVVAIVGGRVTAPEIPTWYAQLSKPSWTPPRLAFPIVWPILYVMMAVAVWRFWQADASSLRSAVLVLFAVQLALNAVWSPIFFGRHDILGGMIVIGLLAVVLAATVATGFQVDRLGALLLVPYLVWVLFAASLNTRIWMLN